MGKNTQLYWLEEIVRITDRDIFNKETEIEMLRDEIKHLKEIRMKHILDIVELEKDATSSPGKMVDLYDVFQSLSKGDYK